MRKVKLPRINNEVEEDQMKVDGVDSLLEKGGKRSRQVAIKEKLPIIRTPDKNSCDYTI